MRIPVRLVATGAMVAGLSLAIAAPSGVAGAKAPKQVKGTCTSLSGSETSQTLSGCNDPADTGGSGTDTPTLTGGSTGTASITWASGLTTTESFTYTEATGKKDKCPAISGDTSVAEAKEVSTVTGGTATDLIGTKTLKSTDCAYQDSHGNLIVTNFPGKAVPF